MCLQLHLHASVFTVVPNANSYTDVHLHTSMSHTPYSYNYAHLYCLSPLPAAIVAHIGVYFLARCLKSQSLTCAFATTQQHNKLKTNNKNLHVRLLQFFGDFISLTGSICMMPLDLVLVLALFVKVSMIPQHML